MSYLEVCALLACTFLFLGVLSLGLTGFRREQSAGAGRRKVMYRMAEKGRSLAWYERTKQWLIRNGASYHFGEKIGPMGFLLLRILLGITGLLVFFLLAPSYGILAGTVLFFLPSGLVLYMNGKDNIKMLPDLKHMYHSLEIQTRAGVFVTDAMAELYWSVRERRLKQALLELAGDLVMRSDLGDALERFQKKFDNRYVDSLCMIILQAMESGQSVDLLSDLSEQIKDMEASVLSQKKEALDRSVTFYQLGILIAVMGVVLYACVTQMFAAATGF
ncbi:MAG: type II secretion system F family protein [Lachnospiraceae bacterium]|nr:type II secretion system F family protein [Lachnospiraceae bacterium]